MTGLFASAAYPALKDRACAAPHTVKWIARVNLHAPYDYELRWLLEESPLSVFRVEPISDSQWHRPWNRQPASLIGSDHPAAELADALLSGDAELVHEVYDKHLYNQPTSYIKNQHLMVAQRAAAHVINDDLCETADEAESSTGG